MSNSEPVTERYVHVWLDHPAIGCGWRRLIVAERGRKWVTLFYWPTLTKFRMSAADFDAAKPRPLPARRLLWLSRTIAKQQRLFKRLGLSTGGKTTKTLIREFRNAAFQADA